MVKIMENVPCKKARMVMVPKQKPTIDGQPGAETIAYKGLVIPQSLNRKLLNRCGVEIKPYANGLDREEVEQIVKEANGEKDLFIRYADLKPLSLVTGRFSELSPRRIISETAKALGTQPTIRYFRDNESIQANFPIYSRFKGLNLLVDTGDFGVYGGSGRNAVKYGISWYNNICANWTIFLNKQLQEGLGKLVHMGGNCLENKIKQMTAMTDALAGKIENSRNKFIDSNLLKSYFNKYYEKGLNKRITDQILAENADGMSVYDLSYRLTELCQNDKLSDVTRGRIEFLAGEVILCYDSIMKGIFDQKKPVLAPGQRHYSRFHNAYVEMR